MLDNFIDKRIREFLKSNNSKKVITRFPPEPNGYLHIGHVKSMCINHNMAKKYGGLFYLRFDDTNPKTKKKLFAEAIKNDLNWLGFNYDQVSYTSQYFNRLYKFAIKLIKDRNAYVCSLSHENIKKYRGTLIKPGISSPYITRSVAENLRLFDDMKRGQFKEGEHVLRAKIDMSSSNVNMRDPVIYRIINNNSNTHIYPMYDFAHSLSDAIEDVSHSLCTIEFEDHRPLYNWFIKKVFNEKKSSQIEFARLEISYNVTSKRKLKKIVENKLVSGWDDPRLLTVTGMKRRGFTPKGIKNFCNALGVSKSKSTIEISLLEKYVREDLEKISIRRMAVIDPILVTISNLKNHVIVEGLNNPKKPSLGYRKILLTNSLFIERSDFSENPSKDYRRLTLNNKVKLRYGYVISCEKVIKNCNGKIIELICSCDLNSLNKKPSSCKVSSVIHWVPKNSAKRINVRIFNYLFKVNNPYKFKTWDELKNVINYDSEKHIKNCYIEPNINKFNCDKVRYQFERLGYFFIDKKADGSHPTFNKILSLRNEFKKQTLS